MAFSRLVITFLDLQAEERSRAMTVSHEYSLRGSTQNSVVTLEDRFEVLKEIGDGSFGSVALARTRTAGSTVARRGTMV